MGYLILPSQVANSDVRTNAATLLLEVFPLQDHYNNKQEQEEALHKQFTIMKVSVVAIFKVLGLFSLKLQTKILVIMNCVHCAK